MHQRQPLFCRDSFKARGYLSGNAEQTRNTSDDYLVTVHVDQSALATGNGRRRLIGIKHQSFPAIPRQAIRPHRLTRYPELLYLWSAARTLVARAADCHWSIVKCMLVMSERSYHLYTSSLSVRKGGKLWLESIYIITVLPNYFILLANPLGAAG